MPGMNGLDTLKKIRSMNRLMYGTKIIMVTAMGTYNLAVEAIKSGASDFIVKPLRKELLKHTVMTALKQIWLERVEDELRETKREKEKKIIELETINRASITLNHEINTPLQTILAATSLLAGGDADERTENKIKESVKKIKNVLERFSRMTTVKTRRYAGRTEMLELDAD